MKWFFCGVVAWIGLANAYAITVTPEKTFTVEHTSGFKPVPAALEAFLAKQGATKGLNSLCVIGYVNKKSVTTSSGKIAWVHWREGNLLTLWVPAAKGFESKDTLIRSRRNLDLTKDVVESADAIGASTYLVSRDWVDVIDQDCKKRGKTYLIELR